MKEFVKFVRMKKLLFVISFLVCSSAMAAPQLRLGLAGHAFDHLGNINEQGEMAAKTGATIIYATGLGAEGYGGLPPQNELAEKRIAVAAYNEKVRKAGVKTVMGYVCATSIVKLETFDKNWPKELRSRLSTAPNQWLQVGRDGKPLPSWYGGDYQPACMNNPDWMMYEKFVVREQLESGHDGIFFDNPTVHLQGCYCRFCMAKFSSYLLRHGIPVVDFSLSRLRKLTDDNPEHFRAFRCTIARDFIAVIRSFARDIKMGAVITCNNSLNSPDVFYSQCRTLAYNISELSSVEDWVTVEDMSSQPRMLASGQTVEYGAVYKQLHAISHGKPIVAVTLADGDYHTPQNLMRLALAEAAAHSASYLWWPTWPKTEQTGMLFKFRSAVAFMRHNEGLLNNAPMRRDVLLFLPFRRWNETDRCGACELSATLTKSNVQYEILSEEGFTTALESQTVQAKILQSAATAATPIKKLKEQQAAPPKPRPAIGPVVLIESLTVLNPDERKALEAFQKFGGRVIAADEGKWMDTLQKMLKPSLVLTGPDSVRAIIHDQPKQTIVHVYNLNIKRVSSFVDEVHPATNIVLKVRVPQLAVRQVNMLRFDDRGVTSPLKFKVQKAGETFVETVIPKLETSAIIVIR